MAFAGFNEASLAALSQQGGVDENANQNQNQAASQEAEATAAAAAAAMPAITLDLSQDTKPEDKPGVPDAAAIAAAEASKAAAAAEGAAKPDLNSDKVVTDIVTEKGFDPKALQARIIKDKGMTPELITELKAKIDPGVVDAYVEQFNAQMEAAKPNEADATKTELNAQEVAQNKARTDMNEFIYSAVGGEDKFGTLAGVLKKNLPQAEIDVINAKLASDNKGLVSEGLKQAVDAYTKTTGRSSTRMAGDTPNNEGDTFNFMSKTQFQKAITSEKYKTDPAYAAEVDENRMKSKRLDAQTTMPGQYRNFRNGEMYTL